MNLSFSIFVDAFFKQHISKVEGGYFCGVCRRLFAAVSSIKIHVKDKHIETNVRYECPKCQTVFKTSSSIQTHLRKYHPELKGINLSQYSYYYDEREQQQQ